MPNALFFVIIDIPEKTATPAKDFLAEYLPNTEQQLKNAGYNSIVEYSHVYSFQGLSEGSPATRALTQDDLVICLGTKDRYGYKDRQGFQYVEARSPEEAIVKIENFLERRK